jgi:hypothetical protein
MCIFKGKMYCVMKKYLISIVMSLVVLCAFSQEESPVDGKTTKKLTKEQKLEQRRVEEEATAKVVDWMMETRQFVLEADYLSDETGQRVVVSSTINFIAVDSTAITIQLATVSGVGGANGMGGVTTDGSISKFEMAKTGKSKTNYSIHIIATTRIGTYDIFIDVTPSAKADARISGILPGKLNYHGRIVPVNQSRVYKGMSI